MLKSVAGRLVPFGKFEAGEIKEWYNPKLPIRLSRRVGLRTMGSIGAKKAVGLPKGIYLSTVGDIDVDMFPLKRNAPVRRGFHHRGYYFSFFKEYPSYDLIYKYTLDGENWVKPDTGNPVADYPDEYPVSTGSEYDIFYDGSNVYCVVAERKWNGVVKIKKGTISKGVISWGLWITVVAGGGGTVARFYISMTKTPNGYFWIAFSNNLPGYIGYAKDIYVVRSSAANNIEYWDSPVLVVSPPQSEGQGVVSASGSSVYIVYFRYGDAPYNMRLWGKSFDGTTLGDEELISLSEADTGTYSKPWSVCHDGNYVINVIYGQYYSPYNSILRRRVGGVWGDEVTVPDLSGYRGQDLTRTVGSKIYIFYNDLISGDYWRFYYRIYEGGLFGDPVEITPTNEFVAWGEEVASNYELQNNTLMGLWLGNGVLRCVIVVL